MSQARSLHCRTAGRCIAGAALLLLLVAPAAVAQDDSDAARERSVVTVRLDGRTVLRVGASPEQDAETRAARIERRLRSLRENPDAITPAEIGPAPDDPDARAVVVSGVPVVTVTPDDAQDHVTTVDALARRWADGLDDALRRAQARQQAIGGRFGAEVRSSVETAFARLGESAVTLLPRLLAALLVLLLFWAVAAFLRFAMRVIFRRIVSDLTLENLIKQVVYYAVWAIGIVLAIDALGWDAQATATGLGLTGLALGFALKDILSNFVSGILLLASRPFEVGDQIVVGETEGGVEKIMLRATQIRTYDGRVVLVPNAELFTGRITNNTAAPVRRGSVALALGYACDLHHAVEAIRAATAATEGVLAEPPASVRVRELGASDIIVESRFWTDSRRSDYVTTASAVRTSIIAGLKDAAIPLPEPAERILKPGDPERWARALCRAPGGANRVG